MNAVALALLAAFAVAAVADWGAVALSVRPLELVAKPLATALLVLVAVTLDPRDPAQRAWFVAALLLCLAGDVLLVLGDRWFAGGLLAFLLAHLAYVGGFLARGVQVWLLLLGAGLALLAFAAVGARVVQAARARAVTAYVVVISAMVASAIGSGLPVAAAGAVLFYVSDLLVGRRRFVAAAPWMPVAVMITYHLGQLLLVLSLVA